MHTSFKQKYSPLIQALLLSFFFCTGSAFALDLKTAKEQGLVGETENGYIAAVGNSNGDINALISDINAQRKAVYENIAEKNNISIKAVELRAGEKAFSKTPAGQYIHESGTWTKK